MLPFNPDLKVSDATYNDNEYLGIERLDRARQNGSVEMKEYLNSVAVYAYGSNADYGSQNFPIVFQTQGQGKKRAVKPIDGVYYNHLFGKPKKASKIAKTIHLSNARTGEAGEDFYLIFQDRHFQRNQVLYIGGFDGVQLHVTANPEREGTIGWKYRVKIMGNAPSFVPYKYLQAGAVWSGGVIKVSLERSRGTENRSYSPYEIQNQLSLVRQSINVAGNAVRKVMNFDLKVGGKSFRLWYDWERYLTELQFLEAKDVDLLVSNYNKDAEGVIVNYDVDTGGVVPSGMGLWKQIPTSNTLEYNILTESKMSNFITDILTITQQLDLVDRKNIVIDIMGGFGFLEEFNKALMRNTALLTPMPASNLFIKETKGGLSYGNYFVEYRHLSGAVFRFTHHPGFDYGTMAESAPRHPLRPGLPITSYNGFIANFGFVNVDSSISKTNKVGNIEYVYEEGREYVDKTVLGMAYMPGAESQFVATDIDASSNQIMCSQGIHAYYPMSMGKIVCKILE